MKRAISLVALVACICLLSACGGAGRASNPGPLPATQMPATADQMPAPAERELQPLAAAQGQRTVVALYQPTPYTKPVGTHVVDGWLPSYYYSMEFQQDDRLQIGGWGDEYRTYIQFDAKGLPRAVDDATLMLWAYPRGDNSTPVNFDVSSPTSAWVDVGPGHSHYLSTSMKWGSQPGLTFVSSSQAQAVNGFWPIPITGLYTSWQTAPASNYGLALTSRAQNNNFDVWRSSRYATVGQRPMLRLTFQSSAPDFKMPLPRNVAWSVSTELGGWDCTAKFYDKYHDGDNYFSVDFSWDNKNANGDRVYGDPDITGAKILILAAARGTVLIANRNPKHLNGNYVVISHDPSRNPSLGRGFSTRYLHMMTDSLVVHQGQVVQQGDLLGYMGNTGESFGAHLHFGMRYENSGNASEAPLTYATVSGWLMKSFQSECANGQRIRYYMST